MLAVDVIADVDEELLELDEVEELLEDSLELEFDEELEVSCMGVDVPPPPPQETIRKDSKIIKDFNFINSPSNKMVGVEGFEPPTSCSQSRRATRLRYTPKKGIIINNTFFDTFKTNMKYKIYIIFLCL